MHSTGIFTWNYLYELGSHYAEKWAAYEAELNAKGLSRDHPGKALKRSVLDRCQRSKRSRGFRSSPSHRGPRRPHWSCGCSPTTPPGQSSAVRWSRGCDTSVPPRYMARAPSGLSRPPGMKRGRSGRRRRIWAGGVQDGHSRFIETLLVPAHSKPGRPDADAIFDRLVAGQNIIKTAFLRRDDNRAGRIAALVSDNLARRRDGTRADLPGRRRLRLAFADIHRLETW